MSGLTETLCALRVVAALFSSCAPPLTGASGFAEGEYVLAAPIETAQIVDLRVERGQRVTAGEILAVLEQRDVSIAVTDAESRLAEADAQLSDLLRGKRPEELAVIQATLASARAQAEDAARTLARRKDLVARGAGTQSDLDAAATANDVAVARVGEMEANLAVARLPARDDAIKAAQNRVSEARAALDNAKWRFGQRTIMAQSNGRVYDVLRRVGEIAGPTQPIVSMLPDGAIKLKIYVPEPLLSRVSVGESLDIKCDGCAATRAIVSYVSPEPEFTPPVIYSLDARQTLSWLVEARPEPGGKQALQPGQIVDVVIPDKPAGPAP
jgi:HlyD family secretion protein